MNAIIEFLLRRRKILLVVIALITIFFSIKLGQVEMREDEETFVSVSDPVLLEFRAYQQQFEPEEGVLVAFESENLFSPNEIQYLAGLHLKLEQLPGVSEVTSLINAGKITGVPDGIEISPLIDTTAIDMERLNMAAAQTQGDPMFEGVYISTDQHVAALIIGLPGMFKGGSDSLCKAFYTELTKLVDTEKATTGRVLHIGGDMVTDAAVEQLMDRDLSRLFPLALLFSAIVLLVFYRRFITMLVPLAPVLVAIVWVLGLKGWTNIPMTPVSVTLFPLIMVIGLANSIHIISSYRKMRGDFSNSHEAMRETLRAVLKPCFLAAFTTAIGFGSLLVSDVTGISQMGIFAAFGVLSAFFLSVIIIPSALIGSKVFSFEKLVDRNKWGLEPLLQKINRLNQNYPRKVLAFFAVVTLVMAFSIPKIKVEGSMASFAKEKTKLRSDIRFLDEKLSGINSFELILKGEENTFKNPEILRKMDGIEIMLAQNPQVLKVFGVSNLVKIINKALNEDQQQFFNVPKSEQEVAQYLFLYEISGGDELSSFVDETYSTARITIRTRQMSNDEQKAFIAEMNQLTSKELGKMQVEISGFGMLMNHINDNLIETQIESILMALCIILALMFMLFGWKGGLLSILPNVFPIVFFLGIMGMAGIDLNMATSIIASVTIGIVVDDTIHIFYGQREEMRLLNSPSKAIAKALLRIGAAMCVTSLLLVLGFGILTLSESKFIAHFGLLSASAIAAALLADLFISPILLEKTKLFRRKKVLKVN
jgi:uncharacterized protein